MPKWIEITRDELEALLAKVRVGVEQPEEWKQGPTAMLSRPGDLADMIASHASGLRLNERDPRAHEDDDVVDAHICCEHVPATRASHELRIVDQIVALLDHRGERFTKRVLRWVWDYLTDDDEPPF